MVESRRDGLRRLILSEAKGVYEAILEGEVRSPGPGAKSGIAGASLVPLSLRGMECRSNPISLIRARLPRFARNDDKWELERRSNLNKGNAVMRQVKIGLLEKETKLKSGEVDSGCEIR